MPVTVPRASVTQTADDLKARDALLRRFPEVEMIVGKSGRADTPTDPSPLDMVESIITLRPKEHWPRRKLRYSDAQKQTEVVLAALQDRGLIEPIKEEAKRREMLDPASMNAAMRFDEAMREFVLQRFTDFESELGKKLLREFTAELIERWNKAGRLLAVVSEGDQQRIAASLETAFAPVLTAGPGQEDINRLVQQIAEKLAAEKKVELNPELMTTSLHPLQAAYLAVTNVFGSEQPTLSRRCSSLSSIIATSTGATRYVRLIAKSSIMAWPPTTGTPSRNCTKRLTKTAFGPRKPMMPPSTKNSNRCGPSWTRPGLRRACFQGTNLFCGRAPCIPGRRRTKAPICSRKSTARCGCPAGPTSGPSRSSTVSTCWPRA